LEEEFADIDRIDVPIGATGTAAAVAKQQRDRPSEGPQQQQQQQQVLPPPPQDEGPVIREYDLQVLDAHLVNGRKNKHKGADAAAQQDVPAGDDETAVAAAEPEKQRRTRRDVSLGPDRSPDRREEEQQQHRKQQHVQQRHQLRRQQEQGLSPEDDGLVIAPGRGLGRRDSPERSGSEEGKD
jgi:hypothetical protein